MQEVACNELGRPLWIDKKVLEYRPGLRKMAYKYYPGRKEDADNLVTETIMACLKGWQGYRQEGGGFYMWMAWTMRGIVGNAKRASVRNIEIVELRDNSSQADDLASPQAFIDKQAAGHVDAAQDVNTELAQVFRILDGIPYGDDLISIAMGSTFDEVAERGQRAQPNHYRADGSTCKLSRQAVQQRVAEARRKLLRAI